MWLAFLLKLIITPESQWWWRTIQIDSPLLCISCLAFVGKECKELASENSDCKIGVLTSSCREESEIGYVMQRGRDDDLTQSREMEILVKQECDFDSNVNTFEWTVTCAKQDTDFPDCYDW